MSILTEGLKWIVLLAGAGAVLAFFIHNIRSPKSVALREPASSERGQAVSPTALVKILMQKSEDQQLLLRRIQTPRPTDPKKMIPLFETTEGTHVAVENGVLVSYFPDYSGNADQLAKETMHLLNQNGFMEGSCVLWTPECTEEHLLTWILRGDNRQPTGPMRLQVDVSAKSIDKSPTGL